LKPGWIQTYTGRIIYPAEPDPELIDLQDIAAGLAKCCRWAGQCRGFLSVAQHSILVSRLCAPKNALWGLMHDAAEAYLGDVGSPVKKELTRYNELEAKFLNANATKFELSLPIPEEVHKVDVLVRATESYCLMKETLEMKQEFPRVISTLEIVPWPWERAEGEFLTRATELITLREVARADAAEAIQRSRHNA
jgi:hypothetical protein